MIKFKKGLLALTTLTLLSAYVFAKNDGTNREPFAPKQTETPTTEMDVFGTFFSVSINPEVITIVCQENQGHCFSIHDNKLVIYTNTGKNENYNVSSVTQINDRGENSEYIIGEQLKIFFKFNFFNI